MKSPVSDLRVEALKNFRLAGKEYKRGDEVDISVLPHTKVSQLLNQRFLRPMEVDPIV